MTWTFVASTLAALIVVNNLAARVAVVLGLLGFILVYGWPVLRYGIYALVLTAVLMSPLAFPVPFATPLSCRLLKASPSAAHRIAIWNTVDERISERPLIGWGLNTSRVLAQRQGTIDLSTLCPEGDIEKRPNLLKQRLPLHPHNAALQLWLELGAAGALIVAAVVALTVRRVNSSLHERSLRAAFSGTLCALFTVLLLSYGILQGWLIASLFLVIGVVMICLNSRSAPL